MKYEPDRAGGAFAEAESGPDDAGIRPSEKRENVPERCCGKSAVLRRRKRRDHSAVTAGCGDGIDAFGDSKLRESRTAALTGICRQYRRTGKAQRACDNQSAAVRILMAAFFTPWKQKVPLLCDGEGKSPAPLRRRGKRLRLPAPKDRKTAGNILPQRFFSCFSPHDGSTESLPKALYDLLYPFPGINQEAFSAERTMILASIPVL